MEWIYKTLMQRRRATNFARRDAEIALCPIVSIGNLTTGGTGKTPAVQWLARALQKQGWKVGVASRGYGGSCSDAGALVSDGNSTFLDATQAGDEAILHARNLEKAVVCIAKNRHLAVQLCVENGAEIVILDDGFQFWSLPRAFDLILLDAKKPFGNGHLLPRGRLREEKAALSRASAILLTRCERASKPEIEKSRLEIEQLTSAPIFESNHAPHDLHNEKSGAIISLDWLRNCELKAFAGLADNAQFYGALQSLGAQKIVRLKRERGDHHAWKRSDFLWLDEISDEKLAVVTSEKDAVKLNLNWFDEPLFSLRIALQIENETELLRLISSELARR